MAKGANKAGRNPPSCIQISCFTVSITPSINTFQSSSCFMISIISFVSSFETNKVNNFPALAASFAFIGFEAKLLTNPCKLSQDKGITTFVKIFFG